MCFYTVMRKGKKMINFEKVIKMPLTEYEKAIDNGELGAYGEYIKKYCSRDEKLGSVKVKAVKGKAVEEMEELAIAAWKWLKSEVTE